MGFKKRAYGIYSDKKSFDPTQDPPLVFDDEKKKHITIKKIDGVKYYVSVDHYLNREKNFLKYFLNARYALREAAVEFDFVSPTEKEIMDLMTPTFLQGMKIIRIK